MGTHADAHTIFCHISCDSHVKSRIIHVHHVKKKTYHLHLCC